MDNESKLRNQLANISDKEKVEQLCQAIKFSKDFIFLYLEYSIDYKNKTKNTDFKESIIFHGFLSENVFNKICPCCKNKMVKKKALDTKVRHIPFSYNVTFLHFKRHQYICKQCGKTLTPQVPFVVEGRRMTIDLFDFATTLLRGANTLSRVSEITGLNKDVVRSIDMERLKKLYVVVKPDGTEELIKPDHYCKVIAIDEFKLHNGRRYATTIIDGETCEVLWIATGKKKAVVYDFIDYIGEEWMDHVEVVSCDMNSDFQEAFEERCPHIQVIYDYFHIVKNFNDKVINEVRKDEIKRLEKEGDLKALKNLKKSRYLLQSSRKTLERKDKEAKEGIVIRNGSRLFKISEVKRKIGYAHRYNEIVKNNQLLISIDLIKMHLDNAYECDSEIEMSEILIDIMDICSETNNKHFLWFRKLIDNHFEGMIAHATYKVSNGILEGFNNSIKTLRRQSYGLPVDEYFFLKIIDMSKNRNKKNIKKDSIR